MELSQRYTGFVIPGGRQVVFAVKCIRNRVRKGFVKVTDDFQVTSKVMQEGFDGKARACRFGARLLAKHGSTEQRYI